MFSNARSLLFRGFVREEEVVLESINKITNQDIQNVLNSTIKQGIVSSAIVGSDIENHKITNIITNSSFAYDNSSQSDKINI